MDGSRVLYYCLFIQAANIWFTAGEGFSCLPFSLFLSPQVLY